MISRRHLAGIALALVAMAGVSACKRAPEAAVPAPAGSIDAMRLENIATEPGQWLTAGRDAGRTHFSPLETINHDSVGRVGCAWEY